MTDPILVHDPEGLSAIIVDRSSNGTLLRLRSSDGREAWIDPGLVDGDRVSVSIGALLESAATISLVEERLVVGKRVEDTGVVRVHKDVVEWPETVRLDTVRETVEVERVAVGRVVEGPIGVRYEGEVTIVPVLEERLVVEKRLVLVEEIWITRKRETTTEERTFTLRKEHVTVERDAPDTSGK